MVSWGVISNEMKRDQAVPKENLLDPKINSEKYRVLSTLSFVVIWPDKKEGTLDDKDQKWFRSAIGSLLYPVKLSCLDLAQPVQELS